MTKGRCGSSKQRREHRNALMIRQNGRCHYCLCTMRLAESEFDRRPDVATFDHVVPRSVARGLRGNVVLACRLCNSRKGARSADEFMEEVVREGLRFRCITGNVLEP